MSAAVPLLLARAVLAQGATPSPSETELEGVIDQTTIPTIDVPCPNDGVICTWVLDQTGSPVLSSFLGEWVPKLVVFVLVLIAAAIVARLAKRTVISFVRRTASESHQAIRAISRRAPAIATGLTPEQEAALDARRRLRTETLASVVGSVVVFAVWAIAIVIALAQVGLNIGPLLAGAGIIGVALGFGSQSLVKDFLSGTFMLLEDQYGVGDTVDVGEATGVVEAVSLRVTRLRDVEGTVWHVPNGEIRRVGNLSQLWSRSLLDIGVAYDTDLDHASAVITRVAEDMAADPDWEEAILEPPELWGVEQFGPNEVVLRLVIKTQPAKQWAVNREFRARIKKAFDAEGIEIPFPQRTIWVKGEGGVPLAAGVPEAALPGPSGQVHPE